MQEVITDEYEEFQCMIQQNIANHWYKTGQPRITIVMETPLFHMMKLLEMKKISFKPELYNQES